MAEETKKRGDLGKEKSKSSKSKDKKKSSKRVKEIHLRRAESGEMIAKHKHHPKPDGMPEEDSEHIVPQGGLDDHADEHMPPQQDEATAAPAPQPGAQMMGGMNG